MDLISITVGLAIGAFAGAVIGWFLSRSSSETLVDVLSRSSSEKDARIKELEASLAATRDAIARAETELVNERKNIAEQKALLETASIRLSDSFKALSKDALDKNNQMFLDLAKTSFETVMKEAKGELGKKQEAIAGIFKPVQETLTKYEEHIKQLEISRQKAYSGMEEQIKGLNAAQLNLTKETGNLVNALRIPNIRGRWGELTLRKVVELAGMMEHTDFEEQVSVQTEDGKLRPDMIVTLPGGRTIVVDAKVSLAAYLEAVAATDDATRKTQLDRHAGQVREHVKKLGQKSYWDQFNPSPEFVVMFIPGESFFSAALTSDPALLEDAIQNKVILATPTTLVALLKSVAYGWSHEALARNAEEISALGQEMYERLAVFAQHFDAVSDSLDKAVASYNKAAGSLEGRVLVTARKFKELGVQSPEELPPPTAVEKHTRQIGQV